MMESNCEMKSTTMKPQSTQARKEIFHDSFFIRKSIMNLPTGQVGNDSKTEEYNSIHSVNERLPLGVPMAIGSQLAINNYNKTSFMKKFIRNHFVLAFAFVIACLISS